MLTCGKSFVLQLYMALSTLWEITSGSAGGRSMKGVGARLRTIRGQWGLSLLEVEERSLRLALEWGSSSYQISASWLGRVEREDHELSATKVLVLAAIYNIPSEELLGYCQPGNVRSPRFDLFAGPNTTLLLGEGPLGEQARELLPDTFSSDPVPEATVLLPMTEGTETSPYRRGIIGHRDQMLDPMIRAGSIVLINQQKTSITSRKHLSHEFDRPIYFLLTRNGYISGWCELDKESVWLTLIPHPFSRARSQRFKYREEIDVIGQVVAVFMRLVAEVGA
jgi:transcriptional regulator with XRE-family HTH domain